MATEVLEQFGSIERTGDTVWVGRHEAILGWPSSCLTSCDSVVSHRELN
jgi:hypothetical protein